MQDQADQNADAAAAPMEALSVEDADHNGADLLVPFKINLDGEIAAAMVRALVHYLLYLRGQIPCVYDELHTLVCRQREEEDAAREAGTRKRKLVSGGVKRARKLADQADQTLGSSLDRLFQRRIRSVAIVFGSSVATPREVWRIDFDGDVIAHSVSTDDNDPRGKEGAALPRARVVRLCVQKIIRLVLSYATQHFSSTLAVTAAHLLVLAEARDAPIDGFVPKQQLKLRLPKASKHKRTHVVHIQHGADRYGTMILEDHIVDDEELFLWYQSSRPLQGVSRLN